MPCSGASFSICSLPALPKPVLEDSTPILVMPIFFICWKILITASLSFWGVLNTYFATGFTIASAAAQEMRIVLLSSAMFLIAMDSPLVDGPMIAKTFSSSISCLAKETAFSGLAPESLMMSWILLPLMPPLALISSTSISSVLASGAPRNDAGPVTARMAPILMVPAASAGAAAKRDDACCGDDEHFTIFIFCFPLLRMIVPAAGKRYNRCTSSPLRILTPAAFSASMAFSVSSNRKIRTALPSLFCTKAYMYSTLMLLPWSVLRMPASPPGRSGRTTGTTSFLASGEAVLLQHRLGLLRVVHDQPEDAEIGGIGQGQGPDVDAVFGKDIRHFRQPAGLVLEKNGYLLDLHGASAQVAGKTPNNMLISVPLSR